jgi:HEAT repeat protein
VAAALGPEAVNTSFNDLVVKLLSDEDAAVRLRVLQKLSAIAGQVGPLLERITPQLVSMYSDENWRVRRQLNLEMPAVMKHMGQEYFQTHFLEPYVKSLKDSVSEVRNGMAFSLCEMVQVVDSNWVQDKIYPTVKGMTADEYFSRITMVSALKHLLDGGVSERFINDIYALVITSASDAVPNVRLATANVLADICRRDSAAPIIGELRPVLKEMKDDKDKDVRYMAAEALKLI